MKRIPPGGPAANNGVLYQMLWTLFQAATIKIESFQNSMVGELESAILVVEPKNGGDLQVGRLSSRIVQQVKAKPAGGTWTARQVIESVIPDLYLACRERDLSTSFQFVTEGRQGNWTDASDFFRSLASRAAESVHSLDDDRILQVGTIKDGGAFWPTKITERSLFSLIIEVVRKSRRARGLPDEPQEVTNANLLHLLGHLDFVWKQSEDQLLAKVDSFLLDVVDLDTDVKRIRLAMLADLALRSTSGSKTISPEAFFADHGVATIPLSAHTLILRRATEALDEALRLRKYDPAYDVRSQSAVHAMNNWMERSPMMAVVAESGMGKSWRMFAMARSSGNVIPIFLECRPTAAETLAAAAEYFWRLKDNDSGPSLERIAARRHRLLPNMKEPWLVLFLDDVQTIEVARDLVRTPWERLKIRVVLGCDPIVGRAIEAEAGIRCQVEYVETFTMSETQLYVSTRFGDAWAQIPVDVLQMLRQPLLAQIFCSSVVDTTPVPENEYQLFDLFWRRMADSQFPLDADIVESLTERFIDGGDYPWGRRNLREVNAHEVSMKRLDRAGWIRKLSNDQFGFANDRLLNWAVAVVFDQMMRRKTISVRTVGDRLGRFHQNAERPSDRHLGYVAMDLVWLLVRRKDSVSDLQELIAELYDHIGDPLYEHLLPTIGKSIVPIMIERLRTADGGGYLDYVVTEGLIRIGCDLTRELMAMLQDSSLRIRRCALRLARKRPSPELLDQLWQQHIEILKNPEPWKDHANDAGSFIREESMRALRACSALQPQWIETALCASYGAVGVPIQDLVWLIANLPWDDGKPIWERNKHRLVSSISAEHQRCLVWCMHKFPNADDADWLIEKLPEANELIGPFALYALARLDSTLSIEMMDSVSYPLLERTRNHAFAFNLAATPEVLAERHFARMFSKTDPWELAGVWSGYECWIDTKTLRLLLEKLSVRLKENLREGKEANAFFFDLEFLSRCVTYDQIQCFQSFSATELEQQLIQLVLREGGRKCNARDSFVRDPAVGILALIGGEGITKVVNMQLESASVHSKFDGVKYAPYRIHASTCSFLAEILKKYRNEDDAWMVQIGSAQSLIYAKHWRTIIEYFREQWPRIDDRVTSLLEATGPLPQEEVTVIRDNIAEAGNSVRPGMIWLLGHSGNQADCEIVKTFLASAEPGSHMALACVIALGRLGDETTDGVYLLKRELGTVNDNDARFALIRNRSDLAVAVLLDRLRNHFECDTATNLLNDERTRAEAIVITRSRLQENRDFLNYFSDVQWLIKHVPDRNTLCQLLANREIEDAFIWNCFAPSGPIRVVGAKTASIKGVAAFNPVRAWDAAVRVFRNEQDPDRFNMPEILLDIDLPKGRDFLQATLAEMSCPALRASVCRSLAKVVSIQELRFRLHATRVDKLSACHLAGWRSNHAELLADLRQLLREPFDPIASAAVIAIHRLKKTEESSKLVDAICSTQDPELCWIYVDALLQIADPGNSDEDCPDWYKDVWPHLHPFQRQQISEERKVRARKMHETLLETNR